MYQIGASVAVRQAAASDVDAIVAIERVAFTDPPWSRESFASLIDDPQVRFWVAVEERPPLATAGSPGAEAGPAVVGYVVTWVAGDEGDLANLAVAPGWRRRGVGRRLLEVAIGDAAATGVRTLYLEVRESNVAARGLYLGRGFVVAGRRTRYYRQPTEDALVLRLEFVSWPEHVANARTSPH